MNANPLFVRAVRGPIILITVGVLFAIDHAGGLPFERTWPAIIIVIGVLKLLERATAPQYDPAYANAAWNAPGTGTPGQTWNPPNAGPAGQTWTPQYPGGYQAPAAEPPATEPTDPNAGGPRP